MIRVTLSDVFHDRDRGESCLVLADESGLPIFVGSRDAKFITFGLRKHSPRPLSFNLFAHVLEAIRANPVEVQIVEIVNKTGSVAEFVGNPLKIAA